MAISLVSQSVSDYVKLISVSDSAIDWEKSYTDVEIKEDETEEQAKARAHIDAFDCSKIAFKPDDLPTVFVFKNPRALENSRLISNVQLGVAGIANGKSKLEACDLWFRTFDLLLVGTATNMIDDPTYIPRDKNTKMIEKGILQSLSSQGVVSELAGILLSIASDKKNVKKS